MKTQILEEINRYREIMSLKPLTMVNESKEKSLLLEVNLLLPLLKRFGLETAETSIGELIKKAAKEFLMSELTRGLSITMFRNSTQFAKKIPKQTIDSIISQAEKSAAKTLTSTEKLAIEQELRKIVNEEAMVIAKNAGEEYANKIPKEATKSATWASIKNHFGKNWKKYAAAGILALIFAYHYPGETPPEEVPVVPDPNPNPQPTTPCPVGDDNEVKKFHDWLDEHYPTWHEKYGKLKGNIQRGYGICGPRTKKWWESKKDEYLKRQDVNTTTTTTSPYSDFTSTESEDGTENNEIINK